MKLWNVLIISLIPFYSSAQNNLGPRLTAMGNNGAALSDVWSVQANIAGISETSRPSVSINYIKHLFSNEISTQALAGVVPFKNNFIGISFQRYGFSEYNESKVGFAYAKKFGDRLSTGINGNYHQLKISNYGTSTGFSVDVGALYHFKDFAFGAFVRNPSLQKYSTEDILAEIPASYHIGASFSASDKVLIQARLLKPEISQ